MPNQNSQNNTNSNTIEVNRVNNESPQQTNLNEQRPKSSPERTVSQDNKGPVVSAVSVETSNDIKVTETTNEAIVSPNNISAEFTRVEETPTETGKNS